MKIKQLLVLILLLIPLSCGGGGGGSSPGSSGAITLDLTGVYIGPDCQGRTITPYPSSSDIITPPTQDDSDISKAAQLNLLSAVSQTVTDQYVDPDFNGVDWNGAVTTYQAQVQAGLDTKTFYSGMHDLIGALGDEHSYFLSPVEKAAEDAALAGQNSFVGFGVYVFPLLTKGKGTLLAVFVDSPAEHGGLAPHDSILSVNGFPLVEAGISYPERLLGPECTGAVLSVETPGQAPRDVTMVRYHITGPLPVYEKLVDTTDGSRIGYIFIPTFLDSTIPDQVKTAMESLGSLDGLILDNRMNGGGLGSVTEAILGYFTSGLVGNFISRDATRPLNITADPVNNSQTVPLTVLVGEGTVSYGEISSGILQDIDRAKVVGQTTQGNVETLSGFNFSDGSQIWIAHERFDPINSHADWEATGIIPDIEAYADWDTFTFDNDPSVAAAVTLLGH